MIRYFFVGETFGKLLSYEIEREEGSSRNSYLVDIVDSPITFEIKAESDRYRATSCTRENGGNWDDFRMEDSVSEFFTEPVLTAKVWRTAKEYISQFWRRPCI